MTVLEAVAQAEAVAAYREAARRLERLAWIESRRNRPTAARGALRLAHLVSVESVRNRHGAAPDEWERPG